jgi:4-amino-4-deoxy-L-arabinose transferase-like glycosyltransferase
MIGGTFVRVARPQVWPWAAGAAAAAAALAVMLRLRPRLRASATVGLGALAGAAALAAYVTFSTADAPDGRTAWGRVAVVAAFGTALAVALVRVGGVRRSHLAGVIGAAAAALCIGALGVFRHGAVVSSLPAGAARGLCAAAITLGVVALAASLIVDDPVHLKGAR